MKKIRRNSFNVNRFHVIKISVIHVKMIDKRANKNKQNERCKDTSNQVLATLKRRCNVKAII